MHTGTDRWRSTIPQRALISRDVAFVIVLGLLATSCGDLNAREQASVVPFVSESIPDAVGTDAASVSTATSTPSTVATTPAATTSASSTTTSTTSTTTIPPTSTSTTTTSTTSTTTTTTTTTTSTTSTSTTTATEPIVESPPLCNPNYTPCVPIDSDVDCAGGRGNGPSYVRGPVQVIGVDIYDLDRDGDGIGCE